ncbi:UDP-N-acetylmuramoyl-L-alanyl-D-glutamate--2,6-diaminopimelate ligase [Aquirufa antheringensis]|uniref:UDP-N-acetylmuramoyl-L-alanyl-D-glutamate--2, 6-diaminopimelate ligase n=1 Tax=Aquirufa antheringensis TaxID=2516559 RepID=UPI0022A8355D|nr:UDP-N-acetylmuramoyl-L-alanyl-D-glutamate--2,6-diaminopimelate ligase [Aquirufa antheringensis]MCZ2484510.1 UDP-N-acetylmuramoyl-L-alanyl-D-glutamate--2,6-diaminopimelate ligase [Aquirufa antheringensis]MCZ2487621.1 UDP-N-acetylmuramoyl-L-alanyl-D-glutamate--2,6-diaminopimelate ligase [Aquirufa antheringensis]
MAQITLFPGIEIQQLCFDSRQAKAGSVFFAIPGTQVDGHSFLPQVYEQGCTYWVVEKTPAELPANVTCVQVPDSNQALAEAAAEFYGHPSKKLKLVGITGTNGKTTTVTLLFELFKRLGHRCGLISTVVNKIEDKIIPSTHTTPDALSLNALLADMVSAGCSHAFMEVSSHAVVQKRIHALQFSGAIFSNITRDHLDFHETFDEYIKAKKGFFDALPATAFALTNVDDKRGMVMLQNTAAKKYGFGLLNAADFKAKIISNGVGGLQLEIDHQQVHAQLIGTFNAYNLLGIYGAALLLGEESHEVLVQISALKTAPGRFEQLAGSNHKMGIVDYAHTPDALENVLKTIQAIRDKSQRIITVVGCGGNRDSGKRPIMAELAAKYSDSVVLTSDNPRKEDPELILDQMEAGVPAALKSKVHRVSDRKEGIFYAVRELAASGDIILVAGKGHENYQDIQGVKYDFDDKLVLGEAFS